MVKYDNFSSNKVPLTFVLDDDIVSSLISMYQQTAEVSPFPIYESKIKCMVMQ